MVPPATQGTPEAPRAPRAITDLGAGDHLCNLYETEEEHRAVLTPYLRQGLERGEKVVYIVDAHTAETVLGYLRDDGLDPAPFLAQGQLAILTSDETYLRGGAFDPDAMVDLLRSETERALAEGYPALRVTGEMTWALRGLSTPESLIRYEVLLNEFFPGSRCLAICQYDRRRFEPSILLEVLRTHPHVVIGPDVYASPHFVPPASFYGANRAAAELDGWVQGLVERRQAEEALRTSRALLQSIIDGTTDAIYVKDPGGRYLLFSAGAEKIVGKPAAEVLGKDDTSLFPADEAAVVMDGDRRAMATAAPTTYEETVTVAGDRVRTFLSTKGPIQDEDGTVLGLFGIARDITARKAAEEALRESEGRLSMALDVGNLGIWVWDLERHEVGFDARFNAMLGYAAGELPTTEQEWATFHYAEDLPAMMSRVEAYLRGDQPVYESEHRIRTKGGAWAWVFTRGRLLNPTAATSQRQFLGIAMDITARKQVEEALRTREEQLSLVYENVHDILFVIAVGAEGGFRFASVNRRFREATGMTDDQIVGQRVVDVIPAPAHALVLGNYRQAIRTRQSVTWEEVSDYPAGRKHAVVTVAPVFDADGTCTQLIGAVHDITERKAAEAEIRQLNEELEARVVERTAKLEAANRELEAFSYSVSHDLRAPLRAISGFAEILGQRYREGLDEKGRHYLDTIAASSEQLGILIEDLLDYARLGRGSVRTEPVPLGPLVASLRATFGERIAAAGATLEVVEPLAVPLADPVLLERILANLVDNALLYRRPDVPPTVTLSATRHDDSVVLAVADNGIGIPAEYRAKVFEVFARLHGEDEYEGTGIGLSIVRKAARLMGSDVTLESAEGVGSTFRLELPAAGKRSSSEP